MNGNAASEKIFRLLDTPVNDHKELEITEIEKLKLLDCRLDMMKK